MTFVDACHNAIEVAPFSKSAAIKYAIMAHKLAGTVDPAQADGWLRRVDAELHYRGIKYFDEAEAPPSTSEPYRRLSLLSLVCGLILLFLCLTRNVSLNDLPALVLVIVVALVAALCWWRKAQALDRAGY